MNLTTAWPSSGETIAFFTPLSFRSAYSMDVELDAHLMPLIWNFIVLTLSSPLWIGRERLTATLSDDRKNGTFRSPFPLTSNSPPITANHQL